MATLNPIMKVALKYCGSCNPQVDLASIGRYLAEIVARQPDFELAPLSANDVDVVVILCGCPRACGNKPEVRARAKRYLLFSDGNLGDMASLKATLLTAAKG